MKDLVIKASLIPNSSAVQCTMPTADYAVWSRDEGKIFTELSEKVIHGDASTTIILSAPWFDICKRYCRISFINAQTQDSPDAVLSNGSRYSNAA